MLLAFQNLNEKYPPQKNALDLELPCDVYVSHLDGVMHSSFHFLFLAACPAVVKSPLAGDFVTMQCKQFLEEQGVDIVPTYLLAGKASFFLQYMWQPTVFFLLNFLVFSSILLFAQHGTLNCFMIVKLKGQSCGSFFKAYIFHSLALAVT